MTNTPEPITPVVLVGKSNLSKHNQIPFTVISVSADQKTITGNVGPTPSSVNTCVEAGVTPCKVFTVINPGGSDGVDNLTSENLLTINAPSAPVILGTASITASGASGPGASNSLGKKLLQTGAQISLTQVIARITGRNFLRVTSVAFGGQLVPVGPSNIKSSTEINVEAPAFCVTGAQASVAVTVADPANAPVSFANGWIFTPTGPIPFTALSPPLNGIAVVCGPCKTVAVTAQMPPPPVTGSTTATTCTFQLAYCVRAFSFNTQQNAIQSTLFPNSNIALFSWSTDCSSCLQTGTFTGFFPATATSSMVTVNIPCLGATCTR